MRQMLGLAAICHVFGHQGRGLEPVPVSFRSGAYVKGLSARGPRVISSRGLRACGADFRSRVCMPLVMQENFYFFGTFDQVRSCVRPVDAAFYAPLSHMVSLDQVQIADASTKLLASIWFSRSRHLTVVRYAPSTFSQPRSFRQHSGFQAVCAGTR